MGRIIYTKKYKRYKAKRSALKQRQPQLFKGLQNKLYPYMLTKQSADLVQTNAAQNFAIDFSLSSLSNVAELSALYDQYKIMKIKITYMPVNQPSSYAVGMSPSGGVFAIVIDRDGGAALSTLPDYEQYASFFVQPASSMRQISKTWRPQQKLVSASLAGTDYAITNSKWNDMTSTDIIHYGVKVYLDLFNSVAAFQTYKVFTKVWVLCKNTR